MKQDSQRNTNVLRQLSSLENEQQKQEQEQHPASVLRTLDASQQRDTFGKLFGLGNVALPAYETNYGHSMKYARAIVYQVSGGLSQEDRNELNSELIRLYVTAKDEIEKKKLGVAARVLLYDEYQNPIRFFRKKFIDTDPTIEALVERYGYDNFSACVVLVAIADEAPPNEIIEETLNLADSVITSQNSLINTMKPDFRAGFVRRKKNQIRYQQTNENTDRIVFAAYQQLVKQGIKPLQNTIAIDTNFSQPTVSRSFERLGLSRPRKKRP